MDPWQGIVRWGGEERFFSPLFREWSRIDLMEFKIAANDALQIVEENGGKLARSRVDNQCHIYVGMPSRNGNNSWEVYYTGGYFTMFVDPYSGDYRIFNGRP